jgi:lipopolysaccharide heptosyltransferase I
MRPMPGPRVLFVKLSSLGDVIHHLPAVTELAERRPDAHVGWVVEEAYVDLVAMHPAVREAFAVSLRSLRRNPLRAAAWRRMGETRKRLARSRWDYVVDAQGLLKSAVVSRFARRPAFGLDAASARERLAARFYDVRIAVPRDLHAVERNRRLVGEIFGYRPAGAARYGLARPPSPPAWAPRAPYAVLLHAASRADKRWPQERWIALGNALAARGVCVVLPGGTDAERADAARLTTAIPGAMAAPPMQLAEAAALLGNAAHVVGVDTGLTHLALALGTPVVGIYCASNPALTGLHGAGTAVNLGTPGRAPAVEEVAAALESLPPRT